MMVAYEKILAVLASVNWQRAKEVTRIEPLGHANLNFFPGQRGFSGHDFPVGGVMMVANNFDNLAGWLRYRDDLDFNDESPTWRK